MYEHRQTAWMAVIGVGGTVAIVGTAAILSRVPWVLLLFLAFAVVVLVLFGSMTVRVDREALRLHFGIGIIHKTVRLRDIQSFAAVANRWYYGWGIRLIPGGWLYNVSGLRAVELRLDNGRIVRVGTDEPRVLAAALSDVLEMPESTEPADVSAAPRRIWPLVALPAIVLVVGFFVVTMLVMVSRNDPETRLTPAALEVSAAGYEAVVEWDEIRTLTLEDTLPRVQRRTNGFSFGGALRGHFRLAGLGEGLLFVQRDTPPFVLIRTEESYVIVNYREPERTRALYERLRAR
jgi:hypothetical protein